MTSFRDWLWRYTKFGSRHRAGHYRVSSISSSGHLVLTSKVLEWPDQGLLIDVAVHVGTLAAVMIYFWRDLWTISVGTARLAIGCGRTRRAFGGIYLGVSPVIVGFFGRLHRSLSSRYRDYCLGDDRVRHLL